MIKSLRDETLSQAILLRQWRGKTIFYSFFHALPSLHSSLSAAPAWSVPQWGTDNCSPFCLLLGPQPWGVVPQGRRGEAGSPKRFPWSMQWGTGRFGAGNGPYGLLCVGSGTLRYQYWGVFVKKSRLGFQTITQKKGGRLEIWDHHGHHVLCYFLGQIMDLCLILEGFRPLGLLALWPGQCVQIQLKGLPEWMSVTIQPCRTFIPRKLQNLPEKMGEYLGWGSPRASLKGFWRPSMSSVTSGVMHRILQSAYLHP